MRNKYLIGFCCAISISVSSYLTYVYAQTPPPPVPPIATDVTSEDITKFIDNLPRDRVSDRPIKSVEVTGDYRIGVYGVFSFLVAQIYTKLTLLKSITC